MKKKIMWAVVRDGEIYCESINVVDGEIDCKLLFTTRELARIYNSSYFFKEDAGDHCKKSTVKKVEVNIID